MPARPNPWPPRGAPTPPYGERGQASVELVALLPLLAVLAALLWQAVLAGQALWLAGSAAREAARAQAIDADPRAAARRVLPASLRAGLRVQAGEGGVTVRLAVPSVVGRGTLTTVSARARLEPQA
ncbi:MAG: pilus assembly protein [Solirubrobacterales bacterium]|nr:pilus assembly protein [Solirubrobacterales bacterium]